MIGFGVDLGLRVLQFVLVIGFGVDLGLHDQLLLVLDFDSGVV